MSALELIRKIDERFPHEAQLALGELAMVAAGGVVAIAGLKVGYYGEEVGGIAEWTLGACTSFYAGISAKNHIEATLRILAGEESERS